MPGAGQGACCPVRAYCHRQPLLQCEGFLFIAKLVGLFEKVFSQFSELPKLVLKKLWASKMVTSPEGEPTRSQCHLALPRLG